VLEAEDQGERSELITKSVYDKIEVGKDIVYQAFKKFGNCLAF